MAPAVVVRGEVAALSIDGEAMTDATNVHGALLDLLLLCLVLVKTRHDLAAAPCRLSQGTMGLMGGTMIVRGSARGSETVNGSETAKENESGTATAQCVAPPHHQHHPHAHHHRRQSLKHHLPVLVPTANREPLPLPLLGIDRTFGDQGQDPARY